ncbi:DUF4177 domain-containing protein [Paramaledivibacter caminithermalis]|nr:DUF4177 domain-containing protein [Paramaledivibacter caminithermalis]
MEETKDGWRLKQVVVPANKKTGVYGVYCYEIIFEFAFNARFYHIMSK